VSARELVLELVQSSPSFGVDNRLSVTGREPDLKRALRPIAPVETIVVMKILAGRTQDLADVEAIIDSGADRELLRTAVQKAAPSCADALERAFGNVDHRR